MTKLYLVRHAEAEGNLYRRAQGHTDGRLTQCGTAQLEPLAARFAEIPLDAVYSSDLERAYRTAGAIAGARGLEIIPKRGLREIYFGQYEDRPWAMSAFSGDEEYLKFSRGELDFSIPGGESGRQVRERMTAALSEIAGAHDGGAVCAVSHGAALQYFLSQFGKIGAWTLDNTSISLCEYENGKFSIVYAGDNAHTGELSTRLRIKAPRSDGLPAGLELWFRPVRLPDERGALLAEGLAAWRDVYGTAEGFDGEYFLHVCAESASANPRYLQFVMLGGEPRGILHLKDNGRLAIGDGHIALLRLWPELCGHGLGVQLLGEAVSVYRAAGRSHLALRVWEKNLRAQAFYTKHGFSEQGREKGCFGDLLIMRREI